MEAVAEKVVAAVVEAAIKKAAAEKVAAEKAATKKTAADKKSPKNTCEKLIDENAAAKITANRKESGGFINVDNTIPMQASNPANDMYDLIKQLLDRQQNFEVVVADAMNNLMTENRCLMNEVFDKEIIIREREYQQKNKEILSREREYKQKNTLLSAQVKQLEDALKIKEEYVKDMSVKIKQLEDDKQVKDDKVKDMSTKIKQLEDDIQSKCLANATLVEKLKNSTKNSDKNPPKISHGNHAVFTSSLGSKLIKEKLAPRAGRVMLNVKRGGVIEDAIDAVRGCRVPLKTATFLIGGNDIDSGFPVETCVGRFEELIKIAKRKNPECEINIIEIPARDKGIRIISNIKKLNASLRKMKNVRVMSPLTDTDSVVGDDGLHLSKFGTIQLAQAIRYGIYSSEGIECDPPPSSPEPSSMCDIKRAVLKFNGPVPVPRAPASQSQQPGPSPFPDTYANTYLLGKAAPQPGSFRPSHQPGPSPFMEPYVNAFLRGKAVPQPGSSRPSHQPGPSPFTDPRVNAYLRGKAAPQPGANPHLNRYARTYQAGQRAPTGSIDFSTSPPRLEDIA